MMDGAGMGSERTGLDRLLRPRSIAVIGGREAEKAAFESRRVGYEGPIYPVSRTRDSLAGIPAYRRLEDLPEVPDAAYVAIPAEASIDAVATLSAMGAGGAVLYASGFAEIGEVGRDRQRRLLEAAGDMGILGPNCYGIVSYLDGVALWPDDHGGERVDRGVALISQSGNVSISLSMQERGLPVAFLGGLGNQAKDGVAEILDSLLRDDRITAIGLFVETVGDLDGFRAAAYRAACQGVPIVVFKTGESEAAARVALSHTSSMTGSSAAFAALCDAMGVVRTDSLPEFLEVLKFLHVHPNLPGNRLMTMSCSGGEAGILADTAQRLGLPMPAFPPDRAQALTDVLGEKVAIDNPLDYHTYIWGDRPGLTACFSEALRHPEADVGLLALDTPDRKEMELFGWEDAVEALCAAVEATGTPTICASSLPESMPRRLRKRFLEAGVVPMQGFDEALIAVSKAAWCARTRPGVVARGMPSPVVPLRAGTSQVLDEWRAKKALAAHGVPVPDGALVTSPTEAVAAAEAIGYPVVVKACSAALAHKTEAGGVALNLIDADAVQAAADRMAALSDTILVEAMARDGICELIVGITRDPQIGPLLMVGAGGILAELLKDAVLMVPPVTDAEIAAALDKLSVGPLLAGYRGRPGTDRAALIAAIRAVAAFTEAHADRLEELDVNPLIVTPTGAVAADALIRWRA